MKGKLALSVVIAAASGYVSLSYEILWYRTYSFVTWSTPSVFVLLLTAFLMGIAMGARRARKLCETDDKDVLLLRLAALLLVGNLVCVAVIPALALASAIDWRPTLGLVLIGAGILGAVLPILGELGIERDERAGYGVAILYVGNIVGSALGSFLTGFVLMDIFSTGALAVMLGVIGFANAAAVAVLSKSSARNRIFAVAGAFAALLVLMRGPLYGTTYERLLYKSTYTPEKKFKKLVENRHGVIAVGYNDVIFGGGAYDGAFNTSLESNSNGVHRALAIEALRSSANPDGARDILSVGLASGSWAQIIANMPSTKSLTVVEINPGYLPLIREYPGVASVLDNPKVRIEIDDARRWLQRHPDAMFDMIVMNTTFSWRAQSTNLTSVEFLELARKHLRRGGIHYFNTTGSVDLYRTGIQVFPHAMRVVSCLAVSDTPFAFDSKAWERAIFETKIDGVPMFDGKNTELLERLRRFGASLNEPGRDPRDLNRLESRESLLARFGPGELVTDDNMLAELRNLFVYPGPPVE